MITTTDLVLQAPPDELARVTTERLAAGGRFAGLIPLAATGGGTLLQALIASNDTVEIFEASLPAGRDRYPSLTPTVPAAYWYEREIHDLYGLVAVGHPRLDPLVYPVGDDTTPRPRPARPQASGPLDPDPSALPGHVRGEGVFTIPYGPVRSGVFETVEYLVETFGEDIPQLRVRPYLKHRGTARRFAGLGIDDAVLLAERVEGTASVAHAIAFCQTLEHLAGTEVPLAAELARVVHAELERVAHHLDSMIRHAEGAGQAVAYARLSLHKERILRLRASLCGHRFGRGVVRPGGVAGPPLLAPDEARRALEAIRGPLRRDLAALMATPSFLDRLRRTGIVAPDVADGQGALGPVGRASGVGEDVRTGRPYGAYPLFHLLPIDVTPDGDALTRALVRVEEIAESCRLASESLGWLAAKPAPSWCGTFEPVDGTALGWVEAPQGELLYLVEIGDGLVEQAKARTASFHNFSLFSHAFNGDILTDFVFIEASFGVTMAGVAG
jgi:formate hydrogenlyase subunit 5